MKKTAKNNKKVGAKKSNSASKIKILKPEQLKKFGALMQTEYSS